jgi:hypothetical protein
MKLPRRQFLHVAGSAAALPVVSRVAWAQAYPARPVRIIVGFPAGAATDVVARLMGQWLSERLGKPFIVENRAGANSNIAAEVVTRAAANGYALLMATNVNAINTTLYEKLNFNFINDIVPVDFLLQSVIGGLDVARRALDPRLPLRPGLVAYPVHFPPGMTRNVFTTLTSLLPGTVPTGEDNGQLVYHCLDVNQPVASQLAAEEAALSRALRDD